MSDTTAKVRLKSSLDYHRIASTIFNQPLLIRPQELGITLDYLSRRMGFEVGTEVEVPLSRVSMGPTDLSQFDYRTSEHGYKVFGKTAVIDVMGKLIHRGDWMDAMSGLCSYLSLERQTKMALEDSSVDDIIYLHDTPGGVVNGAFDTADYIYEASKVKPMRAIVSELSCSGGFLLASAVGPGNIVVSRTSEVGSVGVATAHLDISKSMESEGRVMTLIFAGDHKVDGNPYNALPEEVKKVMQEGVNRVYELFTSTVSRNLEIPQDEVKGTQARVYGAEEAIEIGFAHRVGTLSTELKAQRKDGRTRPKKSQEIQMNDEEKAQLRSEGVTAGARAEQERIKGIMTHASAVGRETLAQHLAYNTQMSVEDSAKMLEASPKSAATTQEKPKEDTKKSSFDKHMENLNSDVGDGSGNPSKTAADDERARREELVKGIVSYLPNNQKENVR